MANTTNKTTRGAAIRIPLLSLALAALALVALVASASAEVVYRAAPAGTVAAAPSLGFAESEIAELGSLVKLAGSSRVDPTVGLGLSVWSCQHGTWDSGCTTTPGSGFDLPLTLSVYAVGAGGEPGQLLTRSEQSFHLAYRPSADGCTDPEGNPNGFTAADGSCSDGLPQQVAWTLTGVTLPAEAIVTVAFDATASAAAEEVGPSFAAADVGTAPRAAEGAYAASGGTALAFHAGGEWPARQPALTIEASAPATAPPVTTTPAPAAAATTTAPTFRLPRGESLALRRKMTVTFPGHAARLGGPGALIQAKCNGAAAARCIGTLSLSVAGRTHKVPFSISKGRKQYIVVPLGDEMERISSLRFPRAVVTARTVQSSGRSVKTQSTLELK
jgi:hypothetical protein